MAWGLGRGRGQVATSARSLAVFALVAALAPTALGQNANRPLRGGRGQAPSADASPGSKTELKTEAGYRLAPGPYSVETTDLLVLHDEARDKDLELLVRAPSGPPAAGKKFPLVVFSHGMGGSRTAFPELTEHWASCGYVVILPTHADSVELMRRQGKSVAGMFSQQGAVKNVDPPQRVKDLSFILDSLDLIEEKIPALGKGKIDRDRMVVGGHSAGALTTQLAIGMKARSKASPLEAKTIADDRFKAAIVVSGQGVSRGWIGKDAWEGIHKPMLVITGSADTVSVSKETPETRRHPFEYAAAGDKYLMFIEGATHSSYQGVSKLALLGEKDPPNVKDIQSLVAAGTTAFLDAYVGQELGTSQGGKDYLTGTKFEEFSGGILEFKRK